MRRCGTVRKRRRSRSDDLFRNVVRAGAARRISFFPPRRVRASDGARNYNLYKNFVTRAFARGPNPSGAGAAGDRRERIHAVRRWTARIILSK